MFRVLRYAIVFVVLVLVPCVVYSAAEYFWNYGDCRIGPSYMNEMNCELYLGDTPCSEAGYPDNACKEVVNDEDPNVFVRYCDQTPVDYEYCQAPVENTECKICDVDDGKISERCVVCPRALASTAPCYWYYVECIGMINSLCTYENYSLKCLGTREVGSNP